MSLDLPNFDAYISEQATVFEKKNEWIQHEMKVYFTFWSLLAIPLGARRSMNGT